MGTMKTYKGYTLEEARTELTRWKNAKIAAATGKEYQIGSRRLTRYDLPAINREIDFFAGIVDCLAAGKNVGPTLVQARMRR